MTIQNIIFDLGGVLIDLHVAETYAAFTRLGASNFEKVFSMAKQSGMVDALETGKTSPQEFKNYLRAELAFSASDYEIDQAMCQMLGKIPNAAITLLKNLRERYRVFILSNTNAIHLPKVNAILHQQHDYPDFNQLVHKAYFSNEIGLRKPDANAFQFILNEQNINATETLFVDDVITNINSAQQLGFNVLHVTKENRASLNTLINSIIR